MATADAHPGDDYYVQPSTGAIQRQSTGYLADALRALGYQGPYTWAQAQTVLELGKKVAGTGAAPISSTAGEAATGQTGSLPNPLAAVTDFLHRLTDSNTWLRVAEGILGLLLIAVGVAKLTNAVPVATTIARAAV